MEEWLEDYDTRYIMTACLLIYTITCAFLSIFLIIAFETTVPFTKSDYFSAAIYLPLLIASKFILNFFLSFSLSILAWYKMSLVSIEFELLIPDLFLGLFMIGVHRQNPSNGKFRVPLVPFIPALSILFNIGLIMHLSSMTWLRFFVWMTIGKLTIISYYYLYHGNVTIYKYYNNLKYYDIIIIN